MGVFLDTGFYLSILHKKDANASRGGELLYELSTGQHGLLYTSNLIIAELSTLATLRTRGHPLIMKDLEELIWGQDKIAEVLRITPEVEKKTWELFLKVNTNLAVKKDFMSFVDVSNVIISQEHQLSAIVSFDGHFDRFMTRIH